MALRRILKEAAGLTGRGGSECSKPISAVVHQRREMFSLQLPLSWRPQESYFVPNASTEAAVAVQQAGSSWGGPASILAQASDCIHAVGMWLACPKSKISRHRRGQKRQHQKLQPMNTMAQCGLCLKVFPRRSVVSTCRDPACPSGPPKSARRPPSGNAAAGSS